MEKLTKIPSPPEVLFREIRIAVVPYIAFGVVLGLTVLTWRGYVGPSGLVGEVEPVRSLVTAPQAGRLVALKVGLLDKVAIGQPIGEILPADPRALAAQLSLGRARIGYLKDALDTRLRQQNNEIAYLQLRLDWLNQRAELATLRAQQTYFRRELNRQESFQKDPSLFQRPAELDAARRDHDSLNAQIDERARLVSELETAITRLAPEEARLNEEAPAALRSALEIEERELGILEAQLGPITLVSPLGGTVSAVHRRAGEHVTEGELIVTLSGDQPTRVVGYLRQPLSLDLQPDMAIEVRARGRNREVGLGRVLSVGTHLEPILPELLPRGMSPGPTELGLPFLVSLPSNLKVVGGETVDLAVPEK